MIWFITARNKDGTLKEDFENRVKDEYLKARTKPDLIVVDGWLVKDEIVNKLNKLRIPVKSARLIHL